MHLFYYRVPDPTSKLLANRICLVCCEDGRNGHGDHGINVSLHGTRSTTHRPSLFLISRFYLLTCRNGRQSMI